jgi:formate dehydrogenase iron-sulfur subunit
MGYPHPSHPKETPLLSEHFGQLAARSYEGWTARGGYQALRKALTMTPEAIVDEVKASGLRGRGGAGFPTGMKWSFMPKEDGKPHYLCCNADESEPGTFKDREIMRWTPHALIEGCAIGCLGIRAEICYIFVRGEYTQAGKVLEEAIREAYAAGALGSNAFGSGKRIEMVVHWGAGAYICGEETSMLESLEGKRGQVRFKPPLPAISGLFGRPTLINNLVTLASVPIILDRGAAYYRDFGMGRSRGTLPIQLAGNVKHGGLIELAFGVTLRELLYDYGGGSLSGRPIRAVQVGGPLGAYLPESQFDTPLDYEAFAAQGAMLGHGGIVVFDDTVDMAAQARYAMEFCAIESCGKCTPCRIGSTRGVEVIDRLVAGHNAPLQETVLRDLCETMTHGSLCALGGLTPAPVLSALNHFPEDFRHAQHR